MNECGVGFELESKEKGKGKVKIWVVGKGREGSMLFLLLVEHLEDFWQ